MIKKKKSKFQIKIVFALIFITLLSVGLTIAVIISRQSLDNRGNAKYGGHPTVDPRQIQRKVMIIEFNPIIESQGNRRLVDVKGWYQPNLLDQRYIRDVREASNNVARYTIESRQAVDQIPQKADGFTYTDQQYLDCLNNSQLCHQPDVVNYNKILTDFQVCEKLNRGEIDELWLWGGPYFGYWEANTAGVGAFPTNGPIIENTTCNRVLHIMGFNYQNEAHFMLEDLGHRIEGTMSYFFNYVWRNRYGPPPSVFPSDPNELERFTARGFDATTAGCGNIHGSLNTPTYDPNNYWGYDWSNQHVEQNTCDDWENYPNLTGVKTNNNCSKWGCEPYGFKKYWLSRIPNFVGSHNRIHNNWWKYILDFEKAVRDLPPQENNRQIDQQQLKTNTMQGQDSIHHGHE